MNSLDQKNNKEKFIFGCILLFANKLQTMGDRFDKDITMKQWFLIVCIIENKNNPLSDYDRIIVGTSIYAGNAQAEVKNFCADNLDLLIRRPFSLFLSCMTDQKFEIQSFVQKAFPKELINHTNVIDSLVEVFNFDKMTFLKD